MQISPFKTLWECGYSLSPPSCSATCPIYNGIWFCQAKLLFLLIHIFILPVMLSSIQSVLNVVKSSCSPFLLKLLLSWWRFFSFFSGSRSFARVSWDHMKSFCTNGFDSVAWRLQQQTVRSVFLLVSQDSAVLRSKLLRGTVLVWLAKWVNNSQLNQPWIKTNQPLTGRLAY